MGAVIASIGLRPDLAEGSDSLSRISSMPPEPDHAAELLAIACTSNARDTINAALSAAGYALRFAPTLSEFWTCVSERPPDLVLVPEIVDGVAGPELCGDLRMRRSTRHLSIVAYTQAETLEHIVVTSLRAGADDCACLCRPGELGARVSVQLRNNRYRQMLRQIRSERDVLKVAATMDPLTRIPNRRALDRAMADKINQRTAFGLLFLDIDHFKSINDKYGHDVGDQVLKRIALYLDRGIRSNDFCGRYGGEEFLVVVTGADEALAAKVGDRHRRAISAITFDSGLPALPITISVGVAAYDPEFPADLATIVRMADKALYRAKDSGRDQVVRASTLPQNSSLRPRANTATVPRTAQGGADSLESTERALLSALEAKRVSLPILPEVASQALRLANDPNANLQRFAALVDRDPHIAARFISIANSVIYSRGFKTTSTGAAIVRVGLLGARDILFQIVCSASAVGLPRYQEAVTLSYKRSVLAAVAARSAARTLGVRFSYDYLAGLLHNIGEARVYRLLASLPHPPSDSDAAELVRRHHCQAGVELADAWNLPTEIVHACGHHHDEDDATDAVRVVRLADAVVERLMDADIAGDPETPDEWHVPFGISRQQGDALLEEVSRAITEGS